MRTTYYAIFILILINAIALVFEPFATFFKSYNLWLLVGINLLTICAYLIWRIIKTMKNVEGLNFKIQMLPQN